MLIGGPVGVLVRSILCCCSYISEHDSSAQSIPNVAKHGVFFSVCQVRIPSQKVNFFSTGLSAHSVHISLYVYCVNYFYNPSQRLHNNSGTEEACFTYFATQTQQYVGKPGCRVANCDAIPGKFTP